MKLANFIAAVPREERLPLILSWLGEGRVMLAITIAYRLECSVRTIYRDLNVLRDRGYRIDGGTGSGGGIMLRPERRRA